MEPQRTSRFEQSASESGDESIIAEFWQFLRYNKKWWLLPLLIVIGLLGLLIVLSNTAAAPFIYTFF